MKSPFPSPCSDYREMPELDVYEVAGLDEDVSELDADAQYAARAAAEAELDRRDNRSRRRGLPTALDGECAM